MRQLVECVPNFSEGRDSKIINAIASAISSAETADGEKALLLNVDSGEAANRTVYTFVGSPEAVVEAAFQSVKCAGELIDMRLHHGTHPRSGACDVLPIVPVTNISLEECAELARNLAARIFKELGIPSYCYEAAAYKPERKDLAVCRAGEYEELAEKIASSTRKPDFGPETFNETVAKSGAINIGARNFLIAVNFNLNSKDSDLAGEIACDVRQKGRKILNVDGSVAKDDSGRTMWKRGPLKGCKAIGWYIEEYGVAQVSMNITDIDATPLHIAYETVCKAAEARGAKITGTEIIGLIPEKVLIDAGKYFAKENAAKIESNNELIQLAIEKMNLGDIRPFDKNKKVIENIMAEIKDFSEQDALFMRQAIQISIDNIDNGGGPFGAVIVKDGKVIATGANRVVPENDPTAHAEVNAIRTACKNLNTFDLEGCTVYSSCEPCPMCISALYWAGVARICYANTKQDADDINFSDAFIYDQLKLDYGSRSIRCDHFLRHEAIAAFKKWADKEDKVEY